MDEEHSARADFAGATGFSVRRVKLHQLLVNHAVEAGVEFRWGTRVTQIDTRRCDDGKGKIFLPLARRRGWPEFASPEMGGARSADQPEGNDLDFAVTFR